MRLVRALPAVAVLAAVVAAPHAAAVPGSVQDGNDVNSIADIRAVYHDDNVSSRDVTWYVQFWDDIDDVRFVCDIEWFFDADNTRDGTVQFSLEYGASSHVYDGNGNDIKGDTDPDQTGTVSKASASPAHNAPSSTAANTLRVIVNRNDMESAGLGPGNASYDYLANCRQWAQQAPDTRPEVDDETSRTTHTFSVPPTGQTTAPTTPRPQTAAPVTPAPQGRTPGPDGETPQPTQTGEPGPDDTSAPDTSASPDSGDTDDVAQGPSDDDTSSSSSSVLPLAIIWVVALSGGGVAFFVARQTAG